MSKPTRRFAALFVSATVLFTFGSAWAALTSASYAQQSHLMAQWDGIENVGRGEAHDAAATTWVDLVHAGGSSALDMAVAAAQAEWTENGLKRKSGSTSGLMAAATAQCKTYRTIEILCDYPPTSVKPGRKVVEGGDDNHIVAFKDQKVECSGSGPLFPVSGNRATFAFTYNAETFSTASVTCYENGEKTASGSDKDSWGDAPAQFQIGARNGGAYPFIGTIYAIRLYDCQLTPAQIAYNAAVDGERFFGIPADIPELSQFVVAGFPSEIGKDEGLVDYGVLPVQEGDILSAPEVTTADGLKAVCIGYKLYQFDCGDYVEVPGGASSETSFEVTAQYAAGGYKLEWIWSVQCSFDCGTRGTFAINGGDAFTSQTNSYTGAEQVRLVFTPADDSQKYLLSGIPADAVFASDYDVTFTPKSCSAIKIAALPSASEYVQKDLTALWDGIENQGAGEPHNAEATTWVDHVNSLAFNLTGVTIGENYLSFAGSTESYGKINSGTAGLAAAFVGGSKTVEITSYFSSSPCALLMFPSVNCLMASGTTVYPTHENTGSFASLGPNKLSSWSIAFNTGATLGRVFVDDVKKSIGGGGSFKNTDGNAWIGRTGPLTTHLLNGKIYGIRIYKRALTEKEVQINSFLDRIRYKGENPSVAGEQFGLRLNENGEVMCRLAVDGNGFGTVQVNGAAAVAKGTVWVKNGETVTLKLVANSAATPCRFLDLPSNAVIGADGTVTFSMYGTCNAKVALSVSSSMYIQGNLVSHWDGIDNQATGTHVSGANTWVDLKDSTRSFSLGTDIEVRSNCLSLPGKSSGLAELASAKASSAFPANIVRTIETVFATPVGGAGVVLQGPGSFTFKPEGSAVTLYNPSQNNTTGPSLRQVAGIGTYSAGFLTGNTPNSDSFYVNGAKISSAGNLGMNNTSNGKAYLGSRNGADTMEVCDIYAIRVYNRDLTAYERAFNAALDRVRFGDADFGEEMEPFGMRYNKELARFEYKVAMTVDPEVGAFKAGNEEPDSTFEGWYAAGETVTLTFVPVNATIFREFDGIPADAERPSVHVARFTVSQPVDGTMVNYDYEDDYVVGNDIGVVYSTVGPREVYAFTNAVISGGARCYAKVALTREEVLVVGGGGSAANDNNRGGGGGGGVVHANDFAELPVGGFFATAVGAGGTVVGVGENGKNSTYLDATTFSLVAKGGGRGNGGSGATGGGADQNGVAGSGIEGQGYAGGTWATVGGGGGGGADAPGGDGNNTAGHPGYGGDGRWDNITGTLHCYGSGGGGGMNSTEYLVKDEDGNVLWEKCIGWGGADGGGAGAVVITDTTSEYYRYRNGQAGVDGLGGGGGARPNGTLATGCSGGRGGCGTVIVAFTKGHGKPHFAIEEVGSFPKNATTGVAEPTPAVKDAATGDLLVLGQDYALAYEHNAEGLAQVVVTGLNDYAGVMQRQEFRVSVVKYVKSEATGLGDGSDWANAMTLADAIQSLVSNPGEIWCAAGTYDMPAMNAPLTIPTVCTVLGGFAADDPNNAAKLAADGAKTVFDCRHQVSTAFNINFSTVHPDRDAAKFTRCVFARANCLGIYKRGNSSLELVDCDIIETAKTNAVLASQGTIAYLAGGAGARAKFVNCGFYGNCRVSNTSQYGGIYVDAGQAFGHLEFDGCTFATNGIPFGTTPGSKLDAYASRGDLGYFQSRTTFRNCRFVANRMSNLGMCMLNFAGGNSTIENCAFIANECVAQQGTGNSYGIVGYRTSGTHVLRNSTFAWNVHGYGGAMVGTTDQVSSQALTVENCIFHGNTNSTGKAWDINVNHPATVSYCYFDSLEDGACYPTNATSKVQLGEGVITGKLRLATPDETIAACRWGGYWAYDPAKVATLLAADVHESRLSVAVNAGNPASDFSKEPKPNGKRVNLGCYGNTSEAACTPPGMAVRIR